MDDTSAAGAGAAVTLTAKGRAAAEKLAADAGKDTGKKPSKEPGEQMAAEAAQPLLYYGQAEAIPHMVEQLKILRRNAMLVKDPLTRDMFLTVTGPADNLGLVAAQALEKYWNDSAAAIEADLARFGVYPSRYEAAIAARERVQAAIEAGMAAARAMAAAHTAEQQRQVDRSERIVRAVFERAADRRRAARKAAARKAAARKAKVTGKASKNSRAKRR